jgi:hypothetical protein
MSDLPSSDEFENLGDLDFGDMIDPEVVKKSKDEFNRNIDLLLEGNFQEIWPEHVPSGEEVAFSELHQFISTQENNFFEGYFDEVNHDPDFSIPEGDAIKYAFKTTLNIKTALDNEGGTGLNPTVKGLVGDEIVNREIARKSEIYHQLQKYGVAKTLIEILDNIEKEYFIPENELQKLRLVITSLKAAYKFLWEGKDVRLRR